DLLRGVLEMGIPALTPIGEIEGWPAFGIERAGVVVTERLIMVGYPRSNVEALAKALRSGQTANTLAADAGFADAAKWRDDSTVFGYVNAKMLIPAALEIARAHGAPANELEIARVMLDLDHVRAMAFRAGVTEAGVSADASVRFENGHQSLVLDFSRTPPLSRNSLKCVPSGAVAVAAIALSPADAEYSAGKAASAGMRKITGLDFGREIFANITSVAIFALPPAGDRSAGGMPIPDVAAAITVNDPAKSEALWTTILGVASMATGTPIMEGEKTQIAGTSVRTYSLPENMTLYFTTMGNDVVVASTKSAMARTIEAKRKGKSVASDSAFASSLKRLNEKSTKGVFVHAGRCAQIAKMFMPPGELAEAKPLLDALENTVAAVVVEHSNEVFGISANVSGIPNIGDLVGMQLTMEANKQKKRKQLTKAMKEGRWDDALAEVKSQLAALPGSPKLLRTKFKILAVGIKDVDAARACSQSLYEKIKGNANALNGFAWALVTEDQYQGAYNDIALRFSEKSNEMTDHDRWAYLDTLAWAKFKNGDAEAAVKLEKKAIDRSNGHSAKTLQKALAKFEKKSKESKLATTVDPG
ncbi:MAG: hypothetical protein IID33_12505, partial [Planctomycetes bacterium]|nr:hypothetical protein [Planctomycetota bacterium]